MDSERRNKTSEDDPDSLAEGDLEQDLENTRAGAEEEDDDVEALHDDRWASETQTVPDG